MSIAIDIAWDRPTVAQIKATGASGVLRYFSTDSTKNLTAAEVSAYHAAGLSTGDVWETTTGRATQGYQAGIDDATMADGQRKADGLPSDQTIYFAVDEDTDWASVADYFRGAHVVLGDDAHGIPRAGCYGGFRVIEGAYGAGLRRLWQTLAWSGGRRSAHACLYQDGRTVLGGAADINQVLAPDWGQYPHPSGGDMPLTDADAELVAKHVAGFLIPNQFNKDAKGVPVPTPVGTFLQYGDKHYKDIMGELASVKLENEQLKTSLAAGVASLSAAVAKLASGGVDPQVVAADVLHELSAALGAAVPPTKP